MTNQIAVPRPAVQPSSGRPAIVPSAAASRPMLAELEARLPPRPESRQATSGGPPRSTGTALRTALRNAPRTIDELVEIARRHGWPRATRVAVREWVQQEPGVLPDGSSGWMLPPIPVRPQQSPSSRPPVVGDHRSVWVTRLGTRYHVRDDCGSLVVPRATSLFEGGGNSSLTAMSLSEARAWDYEPCASCCAATRGRR